MSEIVWDRKAFDDWDKFQRLLWTVRSLNSSNNHIERTTEAIALADELDQSIVDEPLGLIGQLKRSYYDACQSLVDKKKAADSSPPPPVPKPKGKR